MFRSLLLFCLGYFKSRTQLQLEIVYLRKQLEILARKSRKPRIRPSDRFFFGILTSILSSWKSTLLIIKPETVIRWHRQGFRLFWRWKSQSEAGRPKIPRDQIALIKQMANDNPLWGAPRIHGEMLKLGFEISEATVQRYMTKKVPRTTRQRWKTFLKNHSAQIVSVDFLVVPTITFKLLYVLVFLSHDRRRIIHFNVTAHPTAQWSAQQLRNAFSDVEPPRFLIRDRDTKFGEVFTETVSALGMEPILTAYRSPWQNGFAERLIGSIRRECLDHLIIVNKGHLRGILQRYIRYYNTQRTHLGIGKDSPEPREVQGSGKIDKVAVANGLHHFYFRKAA
ncbi:MAG: integrase core domain-containing protein [Ignavibacteria bacterium]|nr:integrase core domain-containing protein [Ignavibacteria bacterium]